MNKDTNQKNKKGFLNNVKSFLKKKQQKIKQGKSKPKKTQNSNSETSNIPKAFMKKTENNTDKTDKNVKDKKVKFSKKHPKIAITIRIAIILLILMIVIGTGIVVGIIYGMWGDDFDISKEDLALTGNSLILDSEGNVIAELNGDAYRKIIKLDDMAKYLPIAYVSIEDERFYDHKGIDLKRTGGAIFTYITKRGNSNFGGSTITQQLVKNIKSDKERNGIEGIMRKIREWGRAYKLEKMLSKEQILEQYLNIIYIGGGKNYLGVEVGAEYYFNKTAKELSLVECAFLAGINNTPNSYNPYGTEGYDKSEAKKTKINKRTKTVLKKMLDLGKISQEEYDAACKEVDNGIKFEQGIKGGNIYSYHTDATIAKVISDISDEKGWTYDYATTYVYGGGLTIYSTQNSEVQKKMEKVMQVKDNKFSKKGSEKNKEGEYEYSQAATVVIDNETGYAIGMIGGLGEKTESRGLNRATQSPRQTGSSMKPLADVLPGLQEGMITAGTMYNDCAVEFKGNYKPTDEGAYRGVISVRSALTTSQNVPFVKIMAELTPQVSLEYLRKMGISTLNSEHDSGLSLAIGGLYTGVTTFEMAAAYATIENEGVYREPLLYTKVVDSQGNTVMEPKQKTERVCSVQNAYIVKDLLKTVANSGTATYCKIPGYDLAAKTGTTNGRKDRWLCGFTTYYTAATWYGYDTPEYIPITGISPASQIFKAVMTPLHEGKAKTTFKKPEGVVSYKICKHTGLIATDKCKDTLYELYAKGKEPSLCDEGSSAAEICESSKLLATEYCPKTITEYFSYTVEKERLKLWTNLIKPGTKAPTEKCTEHTAENSEDNAKPTLNLVGQETIKLKVGEKYTEQGATATDKVDGDITNKIMISGSVNTSKAGTYTVTYKVKNSKDMETTKTRTVIVEGEKPTATPTPTPTATSTPTPTATPTPTPTPTATSTPTATPEPTKKESKEHGNQSKQN